MAKHQVITTNDEITRALAEAQRLKEQARLITVEYRSDPDLDMLVLQFSDGQRHLIARENIEGLRSATTAQIAHVEILGNGTGLHWPDLDFDLYIPALLHGIYGTRRWMAVLGQRGGASKSPRKSQAARANGRKGGRPPKQASART